MRERVLGRRAPDTLTTRHELAYWTGEAGNPAAARDQYAGLLPVRERVSGPEHPEHPDRPGSPRPLDRGGGDPAAARDQYAGLLPVLDRVLGPEHPRTLTARTNFARWAREADGGPSTG